MTTQEEMRFYARQAASYVLRSPYSQYGSAARHFKISSATFKNRLERAVELGFLKCIPKENRLRESTRNNALMIADYFNLVPDATMGGAVHRFGFKQQAILHWVRWAIKLGFLAKERYDERRYKRQDCIPRMRMRLDRLEKIMKLRKSKGMTLRSIGREVGLSGARIEQILRGEIEKGNMTREEYESTNYCHMNQKYRQYFGEVAEGIGDFCSQKFMQLRTKYGFSHACCRSAEKKCLAQLVEKQYLPENDAENIRRLIALFRIRSLPLYVLNVMAQEYVKDGTAQHKLAKKYGITSVKPLLGFAVRLGLIKKSRLLARARANKKRCGWEKGRSRKKKKRSENKYEYWDRLGE